MVAWLVKDQKTEREKWLMKITEQMIRIKAYEIWEASGRPLGSAEENWFAAQDLLKKNSQTISVTHQTLPNALRKLKPH
jgi:hypothetical protein